MNHIDAESLSVVTDGKMQEGTCGAICWWSLREGADHEKLCKRIEEVLDVVYGKQMPRPRPVSKRAAMHRSLVGVLSSGTLRVLNASQMRSIVVHVGKQVEGSNLIQPESIWQLRIDKDQVVEDLRNSEYITAAIVQDFQNTYNSVLKAVDVSDLSSWMVECIDTVMGGVSLRKSTGGTYFVSKENMPLLRALKQLLPEFGSQLFMVPALPSADATEAVLDALNHEINQSAEAIGEEIAAMTPDTQQRVFTSRLAKIEELTARAKKFEGLMGGSLDVIRDKLSTLQMACTMKQLEASGGEAA